MKCSIDNCDRPVRSCGLCSSHYAQDWNTRNKDGIAMCMKPGADAYLDDKAIHPEDLI